MDYKEKYEETLRKAKEYYANVPGSREFLDNIFPQLSESEDEKIRKEIIDYFYGCIKRNSKSGFRLKQYKGWITFLEKQKDSKEVDFDTKFDTREPRDNWEYIKEFCDKFGRIPKDMDELDVLVSYVMDKKQKEQKPRLIGEDSVEKMARQMYEIGQTIKEQKPVKVYDNMDDLIADSMIDEISKSDMSDSAKHNRIYWINKHRQKPAEWSEEDNKTIHLACEFIRHHATKGDSIGGIDCSELINRLKFLRPYWKPSSLELGALRTAISVLTEERNFQRAGKHLQDILDHFEGKETRHDWKPSELQMFALDSAILMFHNLKRGGDKKELESLYNDLKKL